MNLGYSNWESEVKENSKQNVGNQRTLKKKEPMQSSNVFNSPKVEAFLNSMEKENLADFKPIKEVIDNPPTCEKELLDNVSSTQYYKQFVPYYTELDNTIHKSKETKSIKNDELLEKLNYMIHLLEEQKDEKTDNVTEELVLYLFLGVFIIYMTDSFARAGKYIR